MKKTFILFCCAAALVTGLTGCQQKEPEEPVKVVDLRYRAQDSYDLPAAGAKAFTILVASTDPWTVTSEHPDWCIISEEEGDASDPTLVHEGKAEATVIRVQYYDNTFLDDREDKITIQSDYWVGKVITVRQKGSAFLTVSEDDLEQDVTKAGGDHFIHIKSNQDWSAKVTGGDYGTGVVTVNAAENSSELRYAEVTVYDRHDTPAALIKFTQDGVQLVPLTMEVRAGYDQASAEVEVLSNAKWVVTKETETDDWFEILTPSGEGDGKIQLSFTQNNEDGLRTAVIILKNVVAHEGDYAAIKEIVVKQAYRIEPKRVYMNNDAPGVPTGPTSRPTSRTSAPCSTPSAASTTAASRSATTPSTGAPSRRTRPPRRASACVTGSASTRAASSRPTSVRRTARSATTSTPPTTATSPASTASPPSISPSPWKSPSSSTRAARTTATSPTW